ncbi:sensor histidine kinase [Flavobacteriaceae bacterium S356]|uniref:Oxygen sensor histidine kinase NreB n=1 Tax=Asprobacillus argus TaxID=3076534 RepID=A0ABU3LDX2_9FLAO|nr:sensor histidine kinase [Flavobacteriaceae bacterium S356]
MICNTLTQQITKAPKDSAGFYFKKAEALNDLNKHSEAFNLFIKAKNIYRIYDDKDSVAICNLRLFRQCDGQNDLEYDCKSFLDAYNKRAKEKKDTLWLIFANYNYASLYFNKDPELSAAYYHKTLSLGKKIGRKQTIAGVYANLALLYTETAPDSASYFFKEILQLYTEKNPNELFSSYINYANFFQKKGRHNEAIVQLKKAEKITPDRFRLNLNKVLFLKFAECYKEIGNYKQAYFYTNKYNEVKDSINNTAQNIAIAELDVKYQTAEKEKQILVEQQKKRQNRNLFIGAVGFIVLGGFITFLMLKNSKRKRLIAEQGKELETQKNLTLLKEQEISTINAMVEGQEKERKRVAEDLHDNLGSVLATLKLHFENLRINKKRQKVDQDLLFDKTENLIDEAYLKVRSIAHAKNSGVIANEGLLVAVQMMADKISSANKISIEVVHFGLDTPLENSLEIAVFRIIQELTTNILKHGQAANATINVSRHDAMLTIIVEDNGIGFNVNEIDLKTGMGLHSIRTRIEHIKGELIIDSTQNKGTTIIINIPIE